MMVPIVALIVNTSSSSIATPPSPKRKTSVHSALELCLHAVLVSGAVEKRGRIRSVQSCGTLRFRSVPSSNLRFGRRSKPTCARS
eukprot:4919796-Amphidinium_carterae.1